MSNIIDFGENVVGNAMLNGIKEHVKNDLISYMKTEVDRLIEEIAIDITKRFHAKMTESNSPNDFAKQIRLELLYGTTKGEKRYIVESESKVVEVQD